MPAYDQEKVIVNSYAQGEQALKLLMGNYPHVVHPFGKGLLTTSGVQYSTASTGSTGITTNSSAQNIVVSSTISLPGFGSTQPASVNEIEFGLTAEMKATTAGTTLKFLWDVKNATASAWTALHAINTYVTTGANTYYPKTYSGYATVPTKVPFNIRLRMWNKKASVGTFRVKNSSYIRIKSKLS